MEAVLMRLMVSPRFSSCRPRCTPVLRQQRSRRPRPRTRGALCLSPSNRCSGVFSSCTSEPSSSSVLNVPSDDNQLVSARAKPPPPLSPSPSKRGGIGAAASVINALIILSVISAGNSSLYIASRTLQSLGATGRAPKILGWTSKKGRVPIPALVLSNLIALISLLSINNGAATVFTYIINISGVSTFIIFAIICLCHIRFRQAWLRQGKTFDEFPFKAWLAPYGTWFAFILNVVLMFFQGYTSFLTPGRQPTSSWRTSSFRCCSIVRRMEGLAQDTNRAAGRYGFGHRRRLIEEIDDSEVAAKGRSDSKPWYKSPKTILSRILA